MKFNYTVNYAGTYYAPGMEVPVGEEKVAETPKETKEEKPVATPTKKRTTVKK